MSEKTTLHERALNDAANEVILERWRHPQGPAMTIPEQADALIEQLIRAALSVVWHDADEDGEPYKYARDTISKKFATILKSAALVGVERAASPPLRAREEIARALEMIRNLSAGLTGSHGGWETIHEIATDALSSTAGQEWREPEGWQLVPKELTEDMAAEIECSDGTDEGWQRALAACPLLPAPPVAKPKETP